MKQLRTLILVVICLATLPAHSQTDNDTYTVVVSLDGFRWDYTQFYDTPFFDYMASIGVESALIPSFPSKTFPNHYTLATGLYPDHHGIVSNSFYDATTGERFSLGNPKTKSNGRYYGGEPIWNTVQKNGQRAAVYYWPGSDVKVQDMSPWHYHEYDEKPQLTFNERVDGIIEMLSLPAAERPRLVMAYFEQPDANGHRFGPQSKHTRDAVMKMDRLMQTLYQRLIALPIGPRINFIVVSDHGMTPITEERLINISAMLPRHWVKAIEGNIPANIYPAEGFTDSICGVLENVAHIRFWRKADIPARLHYGTNDRIGEIVVIPDVGWEIDTYLEERGSHGFDPDFNDMHALFRAVGPGFRHVSLPHFRNVCLYPLLCHLLGMEPAPNDGSLDDIREMLAR